MPDVVEFATRDAANSFRANYPEATTGRFDRRFSKVELKDDAPDRAVNEALSMADDDDPLRPASLTDAEKERFEFSKDGINVVKLRWIKGLAGRYGVDDWTAYVDPTLTVDEHREVMADAARDESGGGEADESSDVGRASEAAQTAQAGECDHARDHCQYGDPEACEFLAEECGYSETEVERFMGTDETRESAEGGEIPGEQMGALRRSWGGYNGAVADLRDALETAEAELDHAERAFRAINRIREQAGQDPLAPSELNDLIEQSEILDQRDISV